MNEYPEGLASLTYKGSEGAVNSIRAIHPKKRPHNAVMLPSDVKPNRLISRDRIIVEIFFGRLCRISNVTNS